MRPALDAEDPGIKKLLSVGARVEQIVALYPEEVRDFVGAMALDSEMLHLAHHQDSPARSFAFTTYQDLVFEYGTLTRAPVNNLPPEIPVMERQQCFYNAYCLTMENPDLTYNEGFAQLRFLPVRHAWVTDPDGRIIDPTWAGLVDDEDVDVATFYGIKFATDFVALNAVKTGWSSILDREWEVNYPALRHGFVVNDAGLVTGHRGEP